MGLIDILTQYDAKKKAAHAAKTVKHGVRAPQILSYLLTGNRGSLLYGSNGVAKGRRAGKGWVRKWCGEDWRLRSGMGWWGA